MWLAGDKHARYLRRQAWTLTAPFVYLVIKYGGWWLFLCHSRFAWHMFICWWFQFANMWASKIKRASGPPKTGEFCSGSNKSGYLGTSYRLCKEHARELKDKVEEAWHARSNFIRPASGVSSYPYLKSVMGLRQQHTAFPTVGLYSSHSRLFLLSHKCQCEEEG